MKKPLIISGIVAIAIISVILAVYFFIYNKPHPDYAEARAEANVTAQELYNSFRSDPVSAGTAFTGKIIAVSGIINNVEESDSMTIAVFVFNKGDFGDEGVRCTFLNAKTPEKPKIKPGDNLKIKGLCTGFNDTDVILEQCTLTE
jgi:hypothetical protein